MDLREQILPIPLDHPSAKNRFLLDSATAQILKLPSSPLSLVGRQPSLLKGLITSILREPFARSRPPGRDESIDLFIKRRFGTPVPTLISAMCHGIYASSPAELSVRSTFGGLWDAEQRYGSVVLGMLLGTRSSAERDEEDRAWSELGEMGVERKAWSVYGLRGGLSTLTDRLHEAVTKQGVDIRLDSPVTHMRKDGQTIDIVTPHDQFGTSGVISAIPPSHLATLLRTPLSQLDIPQTSVGVISLVLPCAPPTLHPAGFGYLVPGSDSPEGVLGVVFDSTALPGLDSPDLEGRITKLTVMMGGPHWGSYGTASIPSSAEQLVEPALRHLNRVLPATQGLEPLVAVPQLHRGCIPTYTPGHGQRMKELHELLQRDWAGRLSVVGNGYGGVGVNDCVYSAEQAVHRLVAGEETTGLERWQHWQ